MKNKIIIIIFSIVFSILIWGSITLSEQFFSSADLNVKVINQPTGYACGLINPETVSVKLKAKGWQLLSLTLGSKIEFSVSAGNDSGIIKVDPFNEINENSWFSSGMNLVDINPRVLSFLVEKVKYKKLKVESDADITYSEGYGLASPIKVYPDSVLVAGPASILDMKTSIKTQRFDISSADGKIIIICDLETLPGFQMLNNKVELTFDVQRIVEKTFSGIKVVINDIPYDRNIVLIPNTIECSLRGGINILGKITPDQIRASIDYSEIVYDTLNSIQPKVHIPNNTNLVYIKPEWLNYVIKKFE
ncbi:MAG: hypothetical protein Q8M94_13925 [Ignavibacteria bacterium]|nr:hypothetical protein [Ignavibacteria bacterium]